MYNAFMSYSHAADGKLAPRVQSALHRLAKPLFRLRALHVFRDQTTLSATPALWSSIQKALDQSEHFILMAAPEAAASPWVQREVKHWLTDSPAARAGNAAAHFLIILTGGEILWNQQRGDFDWTKTDALPEQLGKAFPEEPFHIDMRGARSAEDVSLHNPEFRSKIADIAATLHNRPKDELIGEDVRIARRNRWLAWSASTALALLAVAASIMAYVANVQRSTAQSRELAAQAIVQLDSDPQSSLLSATAAVRESDTPEAAAALREALVRSSLRAIFRSPAGPIESAGFSPNGTTIVTQARAGDGRGALQLWDGATGARRCEIDGASGGRFTADSSVLVANSGAAFDVATCQAHVGDPSAEFAAGSGETGPVSVDQQPFDWTEEVYRDDSGRLEVAYQDEIPIIRETTGGKPLRTLQGHCERLGGAVFSPDGEFGRFLLTWFKKDLYTESGGGPTEIGEKAACVWGVEFADSDRLLAGHRRGINAAAFGPDAEIAVTGSDDRTARVWVTRAGDELAVLRGHAGAVTRVAIDPDGARILTVSADGTARLWEAGSGRSTAGTMAALFAQRYGMKLPALQGNEGPVELPQLSPNRRIVLAKVGMSRLGIWDAVTGERRGTIATEEFGELRGWLSPDGARVVTTTGDPNISAGGESAVVHDVGSSGVIKELPGNAGPLYGAAYSPDGRYMATAADAGTVRLWDAATFDLTRELPASDGRVLHVAFSADSRRLVTASRDSLARIWDVESGHPLVELFGHEGGVVFASFSPDDSLVVTEGDDGTRVWDAATGKLLGHYLGGGEPFISHDCGRLVVASFYDQQATVRDHPFGACGALDRLLATAEARVVTERQQ
jgi:WD40 repeat protein